MEEQLVYPEEILSKCEAIKDSYSKALDHMHCVFTQMIDHEDNTFTIDAYGDCYDEIALKEFKSYLTKENISYSLEYNDNDEEEDAHHDHINPSWTFIFENIPCPSKCVFCTKLTNLKRKNHNTYTKQSYQKYLPQTKYPKKY